MAEDLADTAAREDTEADQATERAEELVDRMGRLLGDVGSSVIREVVKGLARAREEAEDIWAEAQSVSQDQDTTQHE